LILFRKIDNHHKQKILKFAFSLKKRYLCVWVIKICMTHISTNIKQFLLEIPSNVQLIAVSKTVSVENILEAYQIGQKKFGENKAQELTGKYAQLPKDIEWHLIGHLQTNKVKFVAPFVSLIHSVDSLKLLQTINQEARKNNRIIDCLLQIHIAEEETKFGLSQKETLELLESIEYQQLTNIHLCGLMGMATFTEDEQQVKNEFQVLYTYFKEIKQKFFSNCAKFKEISMGMSDDYKIAIECGSNMVRIGSAIFGERI
jgi:pyridoxal phosphate enzyme (YggS family)